MFCLFFVGTSNPPTGPHTLPNPIWTPQIFSTPLAFTILWSKQWVDVTWSPSPDHDMDVFLTAGEIYGTSFVLDF